MNQVTKVPKRLWKHNLKLDKFFKRDIDRIFDEDGEIYRPYQKEAKTYTFTLEEVQFEDLVDGEIYVNRDGHSLKFVNEDGGSFIFISRSPLFIWKGDTIEGLTPIQLRLFWIITYNMSRGYGV